MSHSTQPALKRAQRHGSILSWINDYENLGRATNLTDPTGFPAPAGLWQLDWVLPGGSCHMCMLVALRDTVMADRGHTRYMNHCGHSCGARVG